MWKRSDSVQPVTPTPAPEAPLRNLPPESPPPTRATTSAATGGAANIGQSVVIKGELTGSEDLVIEGRIEGKVELPQHTVTIGQHATVQAQISAKKVIVCGCVHGNITASAKVEIREQGTVEGDIVSPTVAIADGARFRGSIDMQREARDTAQRTSQRVNTRVSGSASARPGPKREPSIRVEIPRSESDRNPVAAS